MMFLTKLRSFHVSDKKKFACLAFILALPLGAMSTEDSIPEGGLLKQGVFQEGWLVSPPEKPGLRDAARLEGPILSTDRNLTFRAKAGKERLGYMVELTGEDGTSVRYNFRSLDMTVLGEKFPDGCVVFGSGKGTVYYWVRPNPKYTQKIDLKDVRDKWDSLPAASQTPIAVRVALKENTVEVWINEQLMSVEAVPTAGLNKYVIEVYPGGGVQSIVWSGSSKQETYALPVEQSSKAGDLSHPVIRFSAENKVPAAFHSLAGRPTDGIFIGDLGAFEKMPSDDLQSLFWRRHASDNLPLQRLFSVPLAEYSSASILCAVKKGAADGLSFTLRVTRYANSRGEAMADTIVKVPAAGSKDVVNARRVGVVSYGPLNARQETELWLIKVPIKSGLIQDLIFDDDRMSRNLRSSHYLDVDLLAPLEGIDESEAFPPPQNQVARGWLPTSPTFEAYDLYGNRPAPKSSNVTVFGVELEKSPASLKVSSSTGRYVFYKEEKPSLVAEINPTRPGNYIINLEISDVDGNIVREQPMPLTMEATPKVVSFPLEDNIGWYATRVQLLTEAQEELVDFRGSYSMLPPDTRKAGYESPFFGWWFGKNHASDIKLEEIGPLLQRLGIRRAATPDDMPESLTSKYGFTRSTVEFANQGGGRAMAGHLSGKYSLDEAIALQREDIKRNLERWPSIDRMLVFHESGGRGAPFPTELWGKPAVSDPSHVDDVSPEALLRSEGQETPKEIEQRKLWAQVWPKRMEYLRAMTAMVRKEFPQLKMQFGNDGNSLEIMGELFRQKFPKEMIDTIAVEDLGQTIAPERALVGGLHSAWFLRELARKTGYGDLPVTACTEWLGRMTERLGLRTQAEWKVRDGLLALAYGFDTISIAGINDAGDGYYYSIWANGGLNYRYPYLAPKPAFSAVATLTQVLDQAKFQRMVPTGSPVLYVQEFKRGDDWIYPIWTPRGERATTLNFEQGGEYELIDLYGRQKSVSGKAITIEAGTGVQYLVSHERLLGVEAGESRFPADTAPKEVLEEIPLESIEAVEIVEAPWMTPIGANPTAIPKLKPGKFEIREAEDEQMGKCLEIELIPEGEVRDFEHEYVVLKLKDSHPTAAKNAALLVKGNGSWGDIDIWKSRSWGPWASQKNLHLRWRGDNSFNFEGWNFVKFPYYDWLRDTPNAVEGIVLTIPRKVIVGTELEPVNNLKIRIKKLVLF